MAEPVDVYWSFRSPYSYLVTPDLLRLRKDYDVDVRMRIVYPIAIRDAVARAGLDLAELDAAIESGDQLEEVERNQQALTEAGHWGVPTMVVRGEPFFGQDRIDTLRWRLDQDELKRS